MRYSEGLHQYTPMEMERRARKLWLPLKRKGGFDILLTHAPAYGIGDDTDLPHTGFTAFRHLIEKYHPTYMIHGHIHLNYLPLQPRIQQYCDTQVINAYEKYLLETKPKKAKA